jgi:hypothetical protein
VDDASKALDRAEGRLRTALKQLGGLVGASDVLTIVEELATDAQES